ncbi:hypothetical protein ACA910_016216 [Epithemia clementina (nom. ined.)]
MACRLMSLHDEPQPTELLSNGFYNVNVMNVANAEPEFEFSETPEGELAFAGYKQRLQLQPPPPSSKNNNDGTNQQFRNVGDVLTVVNGISVKGMAVEHIRVLVESCFVLEGQSSFTMRDSKNVHQHCPTSSSTPSQVEASAQEGQAVTTSNVGCSDPSTLEREILADQRILTKLIQEHSKTRTSKIRTESSIVMRQKAVTKLQTKIQQEECRIRVLSSKKDEMEKAVSSLEVQIKAAQDALVHKQTTLKHLRENSNGSGDTQQLDETTKRQRIGVTALPGFTTNDNDENEDVQIVETSNQQSGYYRADKKRCPITAQVLENPVRNKVCGHVYSRKGIELLLQQMRQRKATVKCPCPVAGCNNQAVTKTQLCATSILSDCSNNNRLTGGKDSSTQSEVVDLSNSP